MSSYYSLEYTDKDGWPHYKLERALPAGRCFEAGSALENACNRILQKYLAFSTILAICLSTG
jgi:hypothetical protein